MYFREKSLKSLIIIALLITAAVRAQDGDADTEPAVEAAAVSPLQLALQRAREKAGSGDRAGAVEELEGLLAAGFTAVGLLRNDPQLAGLTGFAAYDDLLERMDRLAYPCESGEGYGDFDFWLGEWEVHVASGQFAGSNRITQRQRGCVLVEQWESASGGTGQSINYFDGSGGEWVQVWTDSGGGIIDIRGGLREDGMFMEGTWYAASTGQTLPMRALWTPLEDGRVRQFFEQSADGGATWTTWFEGFYTRKAAE